MDKPLARLKVVRRSSVDKGQVLWSERCSSSSYREERGERREERRSSEKERERPGFDPSTLGIVWTRSTQVTIVRSTRETGNINYSKKKKEKR